jgi:hypothetical protein
MSFPPEVGKELFVEMYRSVALLNDQVAVMAAGTVENRPSSSDKRLENSTLNVTSTDVDKRVSLSTTLTCQRRSNACSTGMLALPLTALTKYVEL